jgi:phage baseplate assembly protein W
MASKILNLQLKKQNSNSVALDTYKDISTTASTINNKLAIGKNSDVSAVKNSIRNIFTWIKGERILDPEFGTEISKLLYEPINTYNNEKIVSEIKSAVAKYEPRAEIDKIIAENVLDNTENNTIELEIIWHVTGLPLEKYSEKIVL